LPAWDEIAVYVWLDRDPAGIGDKAVNSLVRQNMVT
jgi:hypothetical protein